MSSGGDHSVEERKWVLLAMAGDAAAFGRLVRRHEAPVRQALRRYADPTLADDIAQAAFVKAWRGLSELKDVAAFGGWIKRIAVNLCIDALRRRGRLAETGEEDAPAAGSASTADLRLDLEQALAGLSAPARCCVLLHHAEGFSHPEIAERTGIAVGTVKSHIARGVAQLRRVLGEFE